MFYFKKKYSKNCTSNIHAWIEKTKTLKLKNFKNNYTRINHKNKRLNQNIRNSSNHY